MGPLRSTGAPRAGPTGWWLGEERTGWIVARQPGLHDSLRSSTADDVACTAMHWPPPSSAATALTVLPGGAGPPPGARTQAQPSASSLWKTPKEPSMPVKVQWGEVTPY